MKLETAVSCLTVLVGALTLFSCLVKERALKEAMPLLGKTARPLVARHLKQHRALMLFLVVGYVLMGVAFALRLEFVSELFVSMVLLVTAVFVFLKVSIESRLLSGMQETLRGLLPVCAKCRRIRSPGSDGKDPKSWSNIESYLEAHSDVSFTHGYCPECYDELMKQYGRADEKD